MSDKNQFAPTPPMGWNSWDCYGASVREEEVRANADFMAKHLKEYGWDIITVDIQWSEPEAAGTEYRNMARLCMDEYGRLIPAPNRFPSSAGGKGFKPLADYVHGLGLRFGIHIMRGIPRQAAYADCPVLGTEYTARDVAQANNICGWNSDMYGLNPDHPGSQAYMDSIVNLYAAWGVDFIKMDDMTMFPRRPDGADFRIAECEMMRKAIDRCGRPIVYSTSPGTFSLKAADRLVELANMWRISGDFWDNWPSLRKQFDLLRDWNPYMGPGHFPDADMIPIGHLSVRSNADYNTSRFTNFTRDEQYYLMSLWSIARSPLILGCEMNDLDEFSLSLLTDRDIIRLNQASHGNRMVKQTEQFGVWAAEGPGEEAWVGFFNLSDEPAAAAILREELKLPAYAHACDVWTKQEVPFGEILSVALPPHAGTVIRLF